MQIQITCLPLCFFHQKATYHWHLQNPLSFDQYDHSILQRILETDLKFLSCHFVDHHKKDPFSGHLLVQSQQWKQQNNVRNLFKVNNNATTTMSLLLNLFYTLFWCLQCWLWTSKCQLGLIFWSSPDCGVYIERSVSVPS